MNNIENMGYIPVPRDMAVIPSTPEQIFASQSSIIALCTPRQEGALLDLDHLAGRINDYVVKRHEMEAKGMQLDTYIFPSIEFDDTTMTEDGGREALAYCFSRPRNLQKIWETMLGALYYELAIDPMTSTLAAQKSADKILKDRKLELEAAIDKCYPSAQESIAVAEDILANIREELKDICPNGDIALNKEECLISAEEILSTTKPESKQEEKEVNDMTEREGYTFNLGTLLRETEAKSKMSEQNSSKVIFDSESVYKQVLGVLIEKAQKEIQDTAHQERLCGCMQCEQAHNRTVNWFYRDTEGKSVFS